MSFSKTLTYGVKVLGFEVGEIKVVVSENKAVAEGQTYENFRWLYEYDFKFVWEGNDAYLYERERGKNRVYRGEEVYTRKPWIPIIVEYLREGRIKDTELFSVRRENDKVVVIPKDKKRLEKILIYGQRVPEKIEIYGQLPITLILKDVREDKGAFQKGEFKSFGGASS